jgi:hypothetical protein
MKVVNTYFMRKHRYQHQMALAVNRGRKFTTCIFMEYPLHVERVVNSEADKFTELEQHGQMKKLPTPDRQVKQVIKILQRMAMLSYKNKSVMPKNLKQILF